MSKDDHFDYDLILSSLVYSSFHPGGIKSIYERESQKTFGLKLNKYVEERKNEINNICNDKYDLFLKSVTRLKDTKGKAIALKKSVKELQDTIQESGQEILERGNTILGHHLTSRNIKKILGVLQYCKYFTGMLVRITEQIDRREYFKAIVNLKQVEICLKKVREYSFVEYFNKVIPQMNYRIKFLMEEQMNKWLSQARERGEAIGIFLMGHMYKRLHKKKESVQGNRRSRSKKKKKKQKKPGKDQPGPPSDAGTPTRSSVSFSDSLHERDEWEKIVDMIGEDDDFFGYEDLEEHLLGRNASKDMERICVLAFDRNGLNFQMVYRFNLVYSTLGLDPMGYYKNNRLTQLQGFLKKYDLADPRTQNVSERLRGLRVMMANIIGHYAVDNYVVETQELITKFDVASQWESKGYEVSELIERYFKVTPTASYFLSVKETVTCFYFALSHYIGFSVKPLLDLIDKYKGQYSILLLKTSKEKIHVIFENEDFKFLEVNDEPTYDLFVNDYRILDAPKRGDKVIFPYRTTFSKTIPTLCENLRKYVTQFFQYTQYLSNVDATLLDGLNELLDLITMKFDRIVKALVDHSKTPKSTPKGKKSRNTPGGGTPGMAQRSSPIQLEKNLLIYLNMLNIKRAFLFIKNFYMKQKKEMNIGEEGEEDGSEMKNQDAVGGGKGNMKNKNKKLPRRRFFFDEEEEMDDNPQTYTENLEEAFMSRTPLMLKFKFRKKFQKILLEAETKLLKLVKMKMDETFQGIANYIEWMSPSKKENGNSDFLEIVKVFLLHRCILMFGMLPKKQFRGLFLKLMKITERCFAELITNPRVICMNLFCIHNFLVDINNLVKHLRTETRNIDNLELEEYVWKEEVFPKLRRILGYFLERNVTSERLLDDPDLETLARYKFEGDDDVFWRDFSGKLVDKLMNRRDRGKGRSGRRKKKRKTPKKPPRRPLPKAKKTPKGRNKKDDQDDTPGKKKKRGFGFWKKKK